MGRQQRRSGDRTRRRHDPLAIQIDNDNFAEGKRSKPVNEEESADSADEDSRVLEPRIARKVLQNARDIMAAEPSNGHAVRSEREGGAPAAPSQDLEELTDDDEEMGDEESEADVELDEIEVSEEDELALALFRPQRHRLDVPQNLADLLMARIAEAAHASGLPSSADELNSHVAAGVDPKVVSIYRKVGDFLSRYKSGKVPKAFKIIPALKNWDSILWLTNPYAWTPNAVYVATRLFASGLNARMAQRFYTLILLPHVRENFKQSKKLNFHLYQALKKALFKPSAFYKGIVLPLCEADDCSLKEALIVSSVLKKKSVPVLESCACMLKVAEMDYSGACTVFLRVLIDKKYALPRRVLDALCVHFVSFKNDERSMPVLWHQCLLAFVTRYKMSLTSDQRKSLFELIRVHNHYLLSPEIRRELAHCPAAPSKPEMMALD